MEAPKITIRRAQELRRRMTLPEVLLWQAIRGDKLGVRFRRQHPIGPWILDFYCHAIGLAVEIDGAVHDHPDRIEHDRRRTVWLAKHGIVMHRIPARTVLSNMEGVLTGLKVRVERPLHHPSDGPPPPKGEECV